MGTDVNQWLNEILAEDLSPVSPNERRALAIPVGEQGVATAESPLVGSLSAAVCENASLNVE